ncbi:hypothetical protein MASR2M18_19960 [Ignavibacteria bacterium]|nr:hypothetical protein [Bacteroidota bacterium]MCZ2132860.1 hypothetical protein [Bacteroidota bacterium]
MILSKIRRKSRACNIFFVIAFVVSVLSSEFIAQGQTFSSISPFLQSASGVTHPVSPANTANPALISAVESWGVTAAFSPSPFGIAELGYAELLATRRFSERWTGGLGLSGSGKTSLYNEFRGVLLVAVDIGKDEDFTLGAAGEYSQISLRTLETQRQMQLHLGISMRIDTSVIAAASLNNTLRSNFGRSTYIYQEARFGLGITASSQWMFDADIRIAERSSIEAGVKFVPISKVKIRLGYSTFLQAAEIFPAFAVSDETQLFSRLQWSNLLGFSQQFGVLWHGQ